MKITIQDLAAATAGNLGANLVTLNHSVGAGSGYRTVWARAQVVALCGDVLVATVVLLNDAGARDLARQLLLACRHVTTSKEVASLAGVQARFRHARLEQLDGIAGGILEQDLLAANSNNDVVAEMNTVLSKHLDTICEVRHFNEKAVPPSWLGICTVGHGLPAAALTAWGTKDKPQLSAIQHGESWSWVHNLVKVQLAAVERDRGCDVVHDVADADTGHRVSLMPVPNIVDPQVRLQWATFGSRLLGGSA